MLRLAFYLLLMVPLLVIFADFIGLLGSFIGVNIKGDSNLILFFSRAFEPVHFSDLLPAIVKSFLFGLAILIMRAPKLLRHAQRQRSVVVK